MTRPLLLLAALVALLAGMTQGWEAGLIWLAGILAALIVVRRTWRRSGD